MRQLQEAAAEKFDKEKQQVCFENKLKVYFLFLFSSFKNNYKTHTLASKRRRFACWSSKRKRAFVKKKRCELEHLVLHKKIHALTPHKITH